MRHLTYKHTQNYIFLCILIVIGVSKRFQMRITRMRPNMSLLEIETYCK